MGSWLRCVCGNSIHKNLFCGTGISLIVAEDYLDVDRNGMGAEELIGDMIRSAPKLLQCKSCGRLALLRECSGQVDAKFYTPDTGFGKDSVE